MNQIFPIRVHAHFFWASWLSLATLALLTLLVPYCVKMHSIYTTQYVFTIMLIPVLLARAIELASEHHAKLLDYFFTGMILFISVPILIVFGTFIAIIIFIFPRTKYVMCFVGATVILFLLGVRITHKGKRPAGQICLFANHSSFIDYFLIVHAMGYKPYKVVYGTNLHKYPILRFFMKRIGVGVNRKSFRSKGNALKMTTDALQKGFSIGVFPEGTRRRSFQHDKLLPFKSGIFGASLEHHVSIVPAVFDLPMNYSKPDKPFPFTPITINVIYGDVIDVSGKDEKEVSSLVHEWMEQKL